MYTRGDIFVGTVIETGFDVSHAPNSFFLKLVFPYEDSEGNEVQAQSVLRYRSADVRDKEIDSMVDSFVTVTLEGLESLDPDDGTKVVTTKFKRFFGFAFSFLKINHEPNVSDNRSYLKLGSLELVHYAGSGLPLVFEWKPVNKPAVVIAYGICGALNAPVTRGVMVSYHKAVSQS